MKEYTTSEMIALMEKNPNANLQFISEDENRGEFKVEQMGSFLYDVSPKRCLINLDRKWHIIPQPVPWQVAVQAVIDGKTIKVDCPNCSGDPDSCKVDYTGSVCITAIKEGTFYILEDEPID